MENEIKSVSDIIAEISKKDKKRQVFILTNLINHLKSTRAESLWDSRELIMKAISEQNKLIKEEYDNSNK